MALEEGSDDGSYYGEEPRDAISNFGTECGCMGYYMVADIIEDASKSFMTRPLNGFGAKLRANPGVQKFLPIVMEKAADKWRLNDVSPELALIGSTLIVAFGCYVTSPPNAPAEEPAEFTAEESL